MSTLVPYCFSVTNVIWLSISTDLLALHIEIQLLGAVWFRRTFHVSRAL